MFDYPNSFIKRTSSVPIISDDRRPAVTGIIFVVFLGADKQFWDVRLQIAVIDKQRSPLCAASRRLDAFDSKYVTHFI
jgi:hypothetical protein